MKELITQLNCHFTDKEKEKCIPTINRMVELANQARKKGILPLEMEIKQESGIFLRTALLLVTDGTDPEIIKQILHHLILADEYSGFQLLNRLIMAEGVLALQRGENPYIIELRLRSMLGEKYITSREEANSVQNEKINDQMRRYYDFMKKMNNKESLPGSRRFETKFMQIDNRSIQYIIRNTEIRDLVTALYGCGIKLIYKVLDNTSMNMSLQVCEDLENLKLDREEPILEAQEKVLKVIEDLENRGEIINVYRILDEKRNQND